MDEHIGKKLNEQKDTEESYYGNNNYCNTNSAKK